jgi:hypothetical protein
MAGGSKDSSAPSRLTPLQVDLLQAFFAREQRFVLTGGAALAGFYFGHPPITISPDARLPGDTEPRVLDEFRRDLVKTLQRLAFAQTPGPR